MAGGAQNFGNIFCVNPCDRSASDFHFGVYLKISPMSSPAGPAPFPLGDTSAQYFGGCPPGPGLSPPRTPRGQSRAPRAPVAEALSFSPFYVPDTCSSIFIYNPLHSEQSYAVGAATITPLYGQGN